MSEEKENVISRNHRIPHHIILCTGNWVYYVVPTVVRCGEKIFFSVILPSAIPNIFTGVQLGLSSAIVCIVAAEMLAASEGIGYLRKYNKTIV